MSSDDRSLAIAETKHISFYRVLTLWICAEFVENVINVQTICHLKYTSHVDFFPFVSNNWQIHLNLIRATRMHSCIWSSIDMIASFT